MKRRESVVPAARREGLALREVEGELLVYDLERHRAHCLNPAAARVWRQCDGRRTAGQIARSLAQTSDLPGGEGAVRLALRQLSRRRLLEGSVEGPPQAGFPTRREMGRRLGLAAAAALPLIVSIPAPLAVQAGTLKGVGAQCEADEECASRCCPANICLEPAECDT